MNRSNRLFLSFAIWVRSGGESLRVVLPVRRADCNSSPCRLFNFYRIGYRLVRESYSAFFDKSLSKVVAWENRISNNSCIWDSCRCVYYKKCYPLYFCLMCVGDKDKYFNIILWKSLCISFSYIQPPCPMGTPPIFPYGNTPQCYGTRQGERAMP